MNKGSKNNNAILTEHLFRSEYGKIVSVISKYLGTDNVETAEDIVQEALLKAVEDWQQRGIPKNPEAWIFTTSKNIALNILKRRKLVSAHKQEICYLEKSYHELKDLQVSENLISDEQLKMMFICCNPSISKQTQISLILKILCGFSIAEIASAFFSNRDTINKRLVRGRKVLRGININLKTLKSLNNKVDVVLQTLYLLFSEGYSPSGKNLIIRKDLCFEAIRLTELMNNNKIVKDKSATNSLLALMYLNASRFDARLGNENLTVDMEKQDRKMWNPQLIQKGIYHLNLGISNKSVSKYIVMATISANHCLSDSFQKTNWKEILSLYDALIVIEDSPIIRLNRSVALSFVAGTQKAISLLKQLASYTDIESYYLYHSTLASFYSRDEQLDKSKTHLKMALLLATNERDIGFLQKRLVSICP